MSKVKERYRPRIVASTKNMTEMEWLIRRQAGIGGSDAGAILGLNPYKTPFDVWRSKTEPIREVRDMPEAAYWGHRLEAILADEFRCRTGFQVRRLPYILQHPDYPWMIANVDRLMRSPEGTGILEIKTTSAFRASEWDDGRIPDSYWVQAQHYLAVTGFKYAYFATLIGGQRFLSVRVERDDNFINNLILAEENFWVTVELGEPPLLDATESAKDLLKDMYPKATRVEPIYLPAEALPLVEQYIEASVAEKEAKRRKGEAQNRLCALLGDAEQGIVGKHRVQWKNVSQTTFDRKAFEKIHPAIAEEFTTRGTTRRFSISTA